jgi:hypothetical protein
VKLLGIVIVGFNVADLTTDEIFFFFFFICQMLEEKWEYNETVHQLFHRRKPVIQLGGKYCTVFS